MLPSFARRIQLRGARRRGVVTSAAWLALDEAETAERLRLASLMGELRRLSGDDDGLKAQGEHVDAVAGPSRIGTRDFEIYPPTEASCAALINRVRSGGRLSGGFFGKLLAGGREVFESEPRVRDFGRTRRAIVVGDLHGSFGDLVVALTAAGGLPKENEALIFNGDYVDRNEDSTETLALVLALKMSCPDRVHVNRGNHEDVNLSRVYDFESELQRKFGGKESRRLLDLASSCFAAMPLAATIGDDQLVVHGLVKGSMEELRGAPLVESVVGRASDGTAARTVQDVLWSDPDPDIARSVTNEKRGGVGTLVADFDLVQWMKKESIRRIVRSHEVCADGAERVDLGSNKERWTVFSSAQYPRGEGLNRAAILELRGDGSVKPWRWEAVPGRKAARVKREMEVRSRVKALLQRHHVCIMAGTQRAPSPQSAAEACAKAIGSTASAWAEQLLPAAYDNVRTIAELDAALRKEPKLKVASTALTHDSQNTKEMNSGSISRRDSAQRTFQTLDIDGDGRIDFAEFEVAVKKTHVDICPKAAWMLLDADHSGYISPSEFSAYED